MKSSEQLDQIFAALSAAQGEFGDVLKDKRAKIESKSGAKFEYAYADLADAINATKAALTKHGLAVTQLTHGTSGRDSTSGTITITTILGHKSGQYIGDEWEIPASGLDMQRLGSYITYARRYSYTAILGIAADTDDDAQEATAAQRKRQAETHRPQAYKAQEQEQANSNGKTEAESPADLMAVSSANRLIASQLHDRLEVLRVVDLKVASDEAKAKWGADLKAIMQDVNVQLTLRDLDKLRKPSDAMDAWSLVRSGVSILIDHDQAAPVADEEAAA